MMPIPVFVWERTYDFRKPIGTDGLVDRGAEASVRHQAELPRAAASLDSAVIGRGFRGPPEPRGDREVRGGDGKRGSRDLISPGGMARFAGPSRGVGRGRGRSLVCMPRQILLYAE